MKLFPRRLGIFVGISIFVFLLFAVFPLKAPSQATDIDHPFSISISTPEVIEEAGQSFENDVLIPTGTTEQRLELTISITNMTQEDLLNVRFCASLNAEVKPFIASQILTFESDPMPITSIERAQQNPSSSELLISGFEHTWSMLLTTAEELQEYTGHQPEELSQALQSVTIVVSWDGGSQEQTFPLQLSEKQKRPAP